MNETESLVNDLFSQQTSFGSTIHTAKISNDKMSFGFSVGDIYSTITIAKTIYRNCRDAGPEYAQIAKQVRNLRNVLIDLQQATKTPQSTISKQDATSDQKLKDLILDSEEVLLQVSDLLEKYSGLAYDGEASRFKTIRHSFGFGSKRQDLGAIREKLILHTATLAVRLHWMLHTVVDRVETKVDVVETKIDRGFAGTSRVESELGRLHEEIFKLAARERRRGWNASILSLQSVSIHEEDVTVWIEFSKELKKRGFRIVTLDENKDHLLAYMTELDRSGYLDPSYPLYSGLPFNSRRQINHKPLDPMKSESDKYLKLDARQEIEIQSQDKTLSKARSADVGQSGRTKSATRTEQAGKDPRWYQAGNSEAPSGSTAMDPKSSQIREEQGGKKLSLDFSEKHEKHKGQGRRRDSGNAQNHTVRDSATPKLKLGPGRMTTEYHPNKLREIARDELYGHGTQSGQSNVDSYNGDLDSIDLSPRALAVRAHSWHVRDANKTASNLPSPTLETVDPASGSFDDNTSKCTRFLNKAIRIYDALAGSNIRLHDEDTTSTNDAGWETEGSGWMTDDSG
jgi:hypothetical protein